MMWLMWTNVAVVVTVANDAVPAFVFVSVMISESVVARFVVGTVVVFVSAMMVVNANVDELQHVDEAHD